MIKWLYLIVLAIVWGSSFILIKKGLIAFSALELACLRIGISFLALLPFALAQFRKVPKQKLKFVLLTGLFGSGLPPFLFAIAQTKMDSSIAGVLNSTVPLFALTIGAVFFAQPFKIKPFAGVLIGLIGAIILSLKEIGIDFQLNHYAFLVLLACSCYGISVNIVNRYLKDVPSLAITSVSFLFIGIPALFYLIINGSYSVLQSHPEGWFSLGAVALLAIVGTAMANFLFFKLVQISDAVFPTMVTYLIPIVAIFLGILDGEVLPTTFFIGVLFILGGVFWVNKTK